MKIFITATCPLTLIRQRPWLKKDHPQYLLDPHEERYEVTVEVGAVSAKEFPPELLERGLKGILEEFEESNRSLYTGRTASTMPLEQYTDGIIRMVRESAPNSGAVPDHQEVRVQMHLKGSGTGILMEDA